MYKKLFANHMGKDFENLGQRMIYVLATQMSPLKINNNDIASSDSQEELYTFICDFYKAVFNTTSLIGIDELPDECENNTYGGKHYLETRKLMRKVQKKVTDVFEWLIYCGKMGYIEADKLFVDKKEAKITKKKIEIFNNIGLLVQVNDTEMSLMSEKYPKMMNALKYVSLISPEKHSYIYIFRGIFDTSYNYYPIVYKEHCTSGDTYEKVLDYVKKNGFREEFHISDSLHNMKLCYKKIHRDMEFEFLCEYDVRYYYQLCFTFIEDKRVIRWVLENFSDFDNEIQTLFFEKNKKCNKCGYCNQTNKSKPLVYITVEYKGETYELCPYFQYIRCYFMEEDYIDRVLHFFDYVLNSNERSSNE